MRGGRLGKRGYLVQFEPRMSASGAVADEWVPILPGTEGQVALAIGRIMVDEGLGAAAGSPVAGIFARSDVGAAASLSGVSEERLVKLARTFGSFDRPTAIPGGSVAGAEQWPAGRDGHPGAQRAGRAPGRRRQRVHADPAAPWTRCWAARRPRPTPMSRR